LGSNILGLAGENTGGSYKELRSKRVEFRHCANVEIREPLMGLDSGIRWVATLHSFIPTSILCDALAKGFQTVGPTRPSTVLGDNGIR